MLVSARIYYLPNYKKKMYILHKKERKKSLLFCIIVDFVTVLPEFFIKMITSNLAEMNAFVGGMQKMNCYLWYTTRS